MSEMLANEVGSEKSKEYTDYLRGKVQETVEDFIENPRESVEFLGSIVTQVLSEYSSKGKEFVVASECCDKIIEELSRTSHPSKDAIYNLITLELMMVLDVLDKAFDGLQTPEAQ